VIDENGKATIYSKAKHIRAQSGKPFKTALLKTFIFRKNGNGFYDAATLEDITANVKADKITDSSININLQLDKKYLGYTVYTLVQHFYKVSSNYSTEEAGKFIEVMEAYKNIPFDGVGLDEYTNLKLFATWELQKAKEPLRERLYSLGMAKAYQDKYHQPLETALLNMRYAPANHPEVSINAINTYMDIMRRGTLSVETAVYDNAKRIFGNKTFVGLHNTHHNHLDGDEIWQTGINWWNVKRDYGHSDEETPTPTQMGIAYGYKMNMLYNMFYNKKIEVIEEKAYKDLMYNIRTHYHAINDVQNWGVSVEQPYALEKINRIENCARLLNQFNPALPEIKLLVVFGREALLNWYPDSTRRGICDINDKLKIEEKAKQIWEAGYLNALVPTDVIEDGRLTINDKGKAVYNNHVFDAVVFLYPEYAKESTLHFLESYSSKGGKLMIEGNAAYDFYGKDIQQRFNAIQSKATVKKFDIKAIEQLGVTKNNTTGICKTADGSYLFNNYEAFKNNTATAFKITIADKTYEGAYCGYAALQATDKGLDKLAATALTELKINGNIVLQTNKPADVFIIKENNQYKITIAGDNVSVVKIIYNMKK